MKGRKNITLLIVVLIIGLAGIFTSILSSEEEAVPISAQSMTEEERSEIDTGVLADELTDYDFERIAIDYSGDVIDVYINKKTSDQYVDEYANDVVKAVKAALANRKSDMTLEKDSYSVIIHGTDGMITIAST